MRFALAAAALAFSIHTASSETENANISRWNKGEYTYRTIKDQRVRAREDWTLTVHPDGSRTMASFVDNFDADVQFNMIQRVDTKFRPLEAFQTHWVAGVLRASGHYVVNGSELRSSVGGLANRKEETVEVPAVFSMQPHPVATDGWRGVWYDRARGGAQSGKNYNIAVAPNAPDPLRGKLEDETAEWVGTEQISVPAGTFSADHYKFRGNSDIWIMMPDRIVVRYATVESDREYVLTKYQAGGGD